MSGGPRRAAHSAFRTAPPRCEALAPGVHAYIQPDGTWCLNNAGIVIGDGATLLIDTAATRARALALKDAVHTVSPQPIAYVVNTHHHGDHTNGNFLFTDTARIIGHDQCAREILNEGDLIQRFWPGVDWGDLHTAVPTDTFGASMRLDVGGLVIELEHVGPAHTNNDVMAFLPQHGVLFSGDLVFSGGTPFVLMGSLLGSIAAVGRLRSYGAGTIVAGHGQLADTSVLDATERYLCWLAELAEHGLRHGRTPLETAAGADLREFEALSNPERLPANLHRAYVDLYPGADGDPLPWLPANGCAGIHARVLSAAIEDMIALGGGRLPTCLA